MSRVITNELEILYGPQSGTNPAANNVIVMMEGKDTYIFCDYKFLKYFWLNIEVGIHSQIL